MLYRVLLSAVLVFATFAVPTGALGRAAATTLVAQAALPSLFSTESQAQAHCPKDVVVWLNIPSGIYHYKGERWYGHTKHGAYACEKEAIRAGDRASENGQ